MTARIVTIDELAELVGQQFRSQPIAVSTPEVRAFEDLTRISEIYRDSLALEIPDDMVEGFHSLSLLDFLLHSRLRPDPQGVYALNYGVERARFPRHHLAGESIHLEFTVASAKPRNHGLLVTYHCQIHGPGGERPIAVADLMCMYLPRHTGGYKPTP